jgi:hypothetical protein
MLIKGSKKIILQYLHMNLNHWILTSLHPTNTYMPCILYDKKISFDIMHCENLKLKISELMNIDNLNYIYENVM